MKIEKTKTGYEVYLMVSEITKSYLIWHDADMNPYEEWEYVIYSDPLVGEPPASYVKVIFAANVKFIKAAKPTGNEYTKKITITAYDADIFNQPMPNMFRSLDAYTEEYSASYGEQFFKKMMSELDNKAKQVKEQKRGQIPIKGYVKMHICLNKKEFDEALGYTDAPRYFVVV